MKSVFNRVLCRNLATSPSVSSLQSTLVPGFYNSEQLALQDTVRKVVDTTINTDWEQWEREEIFPAKQVFKQFGDAGLLGIHRPVEYGGQGLSYKYNVAFIEALGYSKSAGAAMAIGVHTIIQHPFR